MTVTERFATSRYYCLMPVHAQLGLTLTGYARWQRLTAPRISKCAYRLHAAERKIDTKVRNIRQQKCYNDLRKGRRSLAWHKQRASRFRNFALVSAPKTPAGRNYFGFGFQTASFARNAAVRNITQFANGTRSRPRLPASNVRHRRNRYALYASAADRLVLGDLSVRHG